MKRHLINYDTLLKISGAISHSRDFEKVVLMTVESIKTVLDVKGCAVLLFNRHTNELELAASSGLSEDYLHKGPVSASRSIAHSLDEGPVVICDVTDDPRIQYPEEAQKEGIASILSVPILAGGQTIGALRVYTAEPWEVTLEDVNFVQAMASMAGMAIEMARLYRGMTDGIEVLRQLRRDSKRQSKVSGLTDEATPGPGLAEVQDPKSIKRRMPYKGFTPRVASDVIRKDTAK